jgi:hypothetical protein
VCQGLTRHHESVAPKLEELRLEFVARGEHFIQVRLKLCNAPGLHIEHLLRFLTDSGQFRLSVLSSTTMRRFVESHDVQQ